MRLVRGAVAPFWSRQRLRVDDHDIESACAAEHVLVESHREFGRAYATPGNRNTIDENARAGHEVETGDRSGFFSYWARTSAVSIPLALYIGAAAGLVTNVISAFPASWLFELGLTAAAKLT